MQHRVVNKAFEIVEAIEDKEKNEQEDELAYNTLDMIMHDSPSCYRISRAFLDNDFGKAYQRWADKLIKTQRYS